MLLLKRALTIDAMRVHQVVVNRDEFQLSTTQCECYH